MAPNVFQNSPKYYLPSLGLGGLRKYIVMWDIPNPLLLKTIYKCLSRKT